MSYRKKTSNLTIFTILATELTNFQWDLPTNYPRRYQQNLHFCHSSSFCSWIRYVWGYRIYPGNLHFWKYGSHLFVTKTVLRTVYVWQWNSEFSESQSLYDIISVELLEQRMSWSRSWIDYQAFELLNKRVARVSKDCIVEAQCTFIKCTE